MKIAMPDGARQIIEKIKNSGHEAYIVGGCVRDALMGREPKDWDITTSATPVEVKELFRRTVDTGLKHGTVTVLMGDEAYEVTTYRIDGEYMDGRHPESVQYTSSLTEDLRRRDFTINAMALSLLPDNYGELIDPFGGVRDLAAGIIRTPLDPDTTYSDDPLRILRAVRFATKLSTPELEFRIVPESMDSMRRMADRLSILSVERITEELTKMMATARPSMAFRLMDEGGLLTRILPELTALKGVETVDGRGHKDNFAHTLAVLDNVASVSDSIPLRWAALLHDIGKAVCKRYDPSLGWTFHGHDVVGSKMVPAIYNRLRMSQDEGKFVKKMVWLHMRPISLVDEEVTDSAVRRLLFDAGDDIDSLMILCNADITSKNPVKVARIRSNFELVKGKMAVVEEKDRIRNFKNPITGEYVMEVYGIPPCHEIGRLKDMVKEAILDGVIGNNFEEADAFMRRKAADMGLHEK